MNTKQHSPRKRGRVIALCALALVLLGAAAVLILCPHYIYVAGEYLGVRCERVDLRKVTPGDTVRRTLDELNADGSVRLDQSLLLVNAQHPLEDGFVPALAPYGDSGVLMDSSMHDAYAALAAAVKEECGERLLVMAAFRSEEEQKEQYAEDSSLAVAPGTSEHQAGLALDVYVPYYASYGFLKTEAGRFVNSKCSEYGFIIRYPSFGKSETGVTFEPWHIRYVGEAHAKIIYNNHLTLEEYIDSLEVGVWYTAHGRLISRQRLSDDGTLALPEEYGGVVISPDNTGHYIITVPVQE